MCAKSRGGTRYPCAGGSETRSTGCRSSLRARFVLSARCSPSAEHTSRAVDLGRRRPGDDHDRQPEPVGRGRANVSSVVASLGWSDPLPHRPRRVIVAGCSGSGKSTVCRAISALLGLPYTELDSLFHGPGWVPRPEFADDVVTLAAGSSWVAEWQHRRVRPLLLSRADTLVWLDLPRWRVFSQLIGRTLVRRLRRVELWNGNIEPPLWTMFTDPEHILRWAWSAYPRSRQRVRAVLAEPSGPVVVRLRSRREVRGWLAGPVIARVAP